MTFHNNFFLFRKPQMIEMERETVAKKNTQKQPQIAFTILQLYLSLAW